MTPVHSVRIYADSAGKSHFAEGEFEVEPTEFAPPASPLNVSAFTPATGFGVLVAPSGWSGDWHPTPRRQVMAIPAGKFEVRTTDGEARVLEEGDLLLLEDTRGRGLRTRVLGGDALVAVTQLGGST